MLACRTSSSQKYFFTKSPLHVIFCFGSQPLDTSQLEGSFNLVAVVSLPPPRNTPFSVFTESVSLLNIPTGSLTLELRALRWGLALVVLLELRSEERRHVGVRRQRPAAHARLRPEDLHVILKCKFSGCSSVQIAESR